MNSIQIGEGHVYHSRKLGVENSFRYPTFFFLIPCHQEEKLQKNLKIKFLNLISFQSQDYLEGDREDLQVKIKKFLSRQCGYEAEEVWLQTMPRMLGYVFNPVSFWLCRRNSHLEAVLIEVNNTFGERHFYWVHPSEGQIKSKNWYKAEKVFHVSPFFPVEGYYQFRFRLEDQTSRIDINYYGPDQNLRLATWVTGNLKDLNSKNFLQLFMRYGWITLLVVVRIHYQAVKLWFKKNRFYKKPERPKDKVSS